MFSLLKYWWASCLLNKFVGWRAGGGNYENMTRDQNFPPPPASVMSLWEARELAKRFAKWVRKRNHEEWGRRGFHFLPLLPVCERYSKLSWGFYCRGRPAVVSLTWKLPRVSPRQDLHLPCGSPGWSCYGVNYETSAIVSKCAWKACGSSHGWGGDVPMTSLTFLI